MKHDGSTEAHEANRSGNRKSKVTSYNRVGVVASLFVRIAIILVCIVGAIKILGYFVIRRGPSVQFTLDGYKIPQSLGGPMPNYPNVLTISEEMRRKFHPVVKFPMWWVKTNSTDQHGNYRLKRSKVPKYEVADCTKILCSDKIVKPEDFHQAARQMKKVHSFTIGKYDENRPRLYSSDVFKKSTYSIDGYSGERSLHIGIDLCGPVGTKVYSFSDGVIHSAGYNAALGDYGNVIIVEYDLSGMPTRKESKTTGMNEDLYYRDREDIKNMQTNCKDDRKLVWALYGHLDSKSIKNKRRGQKVKKGQLLGRIGNVHENGGWSVPHVHFQLSTIEPETHDMPGVVEMVDRAKALISYPDPRQVLGSLY